MLLVKAMVFASETSLRRLFLSAIYIIMGNNHAKFHPSVTVNSKFMVPWGLSKIEALFGSKQQHV